MPPLAWKYNIAQHLLVHCAPQAKCHPFLLRLTEGISMADNSKTRQLTLKQSRWINSTKGRRTNVHF